MDINEVGK